MEHGFALLDTNSILSDYGDTNLYNALAAMPTDTGTNPVLAATIYGDSVLLKASHFDYSAESRDFALLVCDSPGKPTWKTIDYFGNSDNQDGWVVQGNVAHLEVTDPMFMEVSNVTTDRAPCFFRVIPYSGPVITLSGPNPYDTVSNTAELFGTIMDLSGSTNEQFAVDVDGYPAQYQLGHAITPFPEPIYAGNDIHVQTWFQANGGHNINVSVFGDTRAYDPANPPADQRIYFQSIATMPLDFNNPNYVVWQSDNCSTDVGTNYFLFYVNDAQHITASISDPNTGQVVATYAGDVPAASTVQLAWNFTQADGVTPYSNDTYTVAFNMVNQPPPTIIFTNGIYRGGVRTAGACMTSYEHNSPATAAGAYFNYEADFYIPTLAGEYETLYWMNFGSATAYDPSQIGSGRNARKGVFPLILDKGSETNFTTLFKLALSDTGVTDVDFVGHGFGNGIGLSPDGYIGPSGGLDIQQIGGAVFSGKPPGKVRMRKVAIWSCYSDTPPKSRGGGVYTSLAGAFGIKDSALQKSCWGPKNVGLFFTDKINQGGYSGLNGGSDFELSVLFDELWIAGGIMAPGADDPTFSFDWAVRQMIRNSPEILGASPIVTGFDLLNYAGIYDGELMTNNTIHVRTGR